MRYAPEGKWSEGKLIGQPGRSYDSRINRRADEQQVAHEAGDNHLELSFKTVKSWKKVNRRDAPGFPALRGTGSIGTEGWAMHTDEYEISLGREIAFCRKRVRQLKDSLERREKQ